MADPQLDVLCPRDPGFLIQRFLIQCPRRIAAPMKSIRTTVGGRKVSTLVAPRQLVVKSRRTN
eukprot:8370654-Pyramimonas_sp.AAC.1